MIEALKTLNYLSHAYLLLQGPDSSELPYEVAGTSLPDWLGVVDRKVRVRSHAAQVWLEHDDPAYRSLARGVIRHHADDGWFHNSPAFLKLSLEFAQQIRSQWGDITGMRSGFLGHILVEILLDSQLATDDPTLLDRYYEAVQKADAVRIETWVNQTSKNSSDRIAGLIPRFISEGFLRDYSNDEKLLLRLNQVMRRVRLPELPAGVLAMFEGARERVRDARDALLSPPVAIASQSRAAESQ